MTNYHNRLKNYLLNLEKIYWHGTRSQSSWNYYLPRINKIAVQNKIAYRDVKLWNEISDEINLNDLI